MAKAVFIHKSDSIYDDDPIARYDFPRMYLNSVKRTIGDWIVYYEPRSADGGAGRLSYTAVARVQEVIPHPTLAGRFYAIIEAETYLAFDRAVGRVINGHIVEAMLRGADGGPRRGGAANLAVRMLPDAEFATIANNGFFDEPDLPGSNLIETPLSEFHDQPTPFSHEGIVDRRIIQQLLNRPFREAKFARQVKAAYGNKCAISGLSLRNGGGRPEVEAAHIRPVAYGGPDTVRNGLALSATLHWMFDRGLVAIADDHSILISHNKVPKETADRLIVPDHKLILPREPRNHPHPDYLRYHRENIFGNDI